MLDKGEKSIYIGNLILISWHLIIIDLVAYVNFFDLLEKFTTK